MTLLRTLVFISTALVTISSAAAGPDEVDGADIIDRVDRVLRVNPETASTWLAGVANLETWSARLERALLEALGPAGMREAEAGLESLEILLEEAPTESARETLAVIVDLVERQVSLTIERDRVAQELEAERQAHRQTTDKLNALRQIDHQLDERENNGGR